MSRRTEGFTLTLTHKQVDALLYSARQLKEHVTFRSELIEMLNDLCIIGRSERISFPHAWRGTLRPTIERACFVLDDSRERKPLMRQARKVRKATEASAVDRLAALGG